MVPTAHSTAETQRQQECSWSLELDVQNSFPPPVESFWSSQAFGGACQGCPSAELLAEFQAEPWSCTLSCGTPLHYALPARQFCMIRIDSCCSSLPCYVWCTMCIPVNLFSSRNHTAWCDFTAWASFPIKVSSMWYKQDQRMPFVMLQIWIKNNASSLILWTASADPRQSRMPMTFLLRKNCMLILVLLVYIDSNAVCTQNQFNIGT